MDLGFAVPVSGSWATRDNIVDVAGRAEQLGYSSLWTFQRLLVPVDADDQPQLPPQYRAVHDPLAVLAFLAATTTRCRLGVAIVNMPYQAPIVLAKQVATIDHLCGGRLDLGLGIGWSPDEFEAVGTPFGNRGRRADEYLDALRAIWTDDIVEVDSPRYRVPRSRVDPKPVQHPHPPILLGAAARAALRRIGRQADGWISSSQADLSRIDESIAVVRDAASAAGRDPDRLRFVCRGVVKVRDDERGPLTGTLDEIRHDLADLAAKGVTETFVDLNFDPEIGSPDADPVASVRRAHQVLDALAPS